ncbi:MAG: ABC transporter ATP-binding protein [Spiroplasma sp.]|nr:ABC transporter ATP-binding protein [Spiroplasma sp.]
MSKKKKRHTKRKKTKLKSDYDQIKVKRSGFLRTIFKYFRKYPWLYLVAITATVLSSLMTVVMPKITNEYLLNGDFQETKIMELTYILVSLQVASGILMYLRNVSGGIIGVKIEIEYRNKVIQHLLDLDMSYYEDNKIGDSLTKFISDTEIIGDNMQSIPLSFLSSIVTFVGGMIVTFSINWQMSLIVLGIILVILILAVLNVQIIRLLNYKWRKVYTEVNADVTDRIGTMQLIKSNGTENYEMKRVVESHKKYYKAAQKTINFDGFTRALLVTLLTGINTVGLVTGLIFASKDIIKPEIIISFMLSVNTLIFPIIQSIQFIGNWARASTAIIRVNEITNREPKIINVNDAIKIDSIKGDIIFNDVSFRYNHSSPWILKNFTFTFEQGKKYAIVGATGAGKSTISKLLLRYYDPEIGEILINKNNLKNLELATYLNHIGYIEQDPQILYGDFTENISYSVQKASFAEIEVAAKKANLNDFIQELPNKYKTTLGERGITLSGGQKQRIAIARVFLKNPELLILDEATSALDNIIEKEIQEQFNKLMVGRTSIVIAHRLSTIKNVDQILVLEKDKGLVQIGTFDQLKVQKGHFRNLYQAGIMD